MRKQPETSLAVTDLEALRAEVLKAAARYGARLQGADRDGLAQEAMIRLIDYLNRHEEVERLARSFCWKTTYSVFVDRHRRCQRRGEESFEDRATATVKATLADPESRAHGGEIRRAIQDCLGALKTEYRRAVALRLIGHSIADVAAVLGCANKQADNRVYRGLNRLRKCLKGKGIQP